MSSYAELPAVFAAEAKQRAVNAGRWTRRHLFNSWQNGVTTVVAASIAIWALYQVAMFVFVDGDFGVISANRRLLFIGRIPMGEEWRTWPGLFMVAALIGGSYGLLEERPAAFLVTFALVSVAIILFVRDLETPLRLAFLCVGLTLSAFIGMRMRYHGQSDLQINRMKRRLMALAVVTFALAMGTLSQTIGHPPAGEEWRTWPALILFAIVTGGLLGQTDDGGWIDLAAFLSIGVLVFAAAMEQWAFLGASLALIAVGAGACVGARRWVFAVDDLDRIRRVLRVRQTAAAVAILGYLIARPMIGVSEEQGIPTDLWGGFLLNILLATAGIVLGFGLGIILAFARMSKLPLFRWSATGIIEVVRSGPLIAWLFLALFLLPDFLSPVWEADIILRSILVLAVFTGCYIAEILRGGLQTVASGQVEAARALGLTETQTKITILLPQGIRGVIPALVSQMIALWKDTAIVYLVGIFDLFESAKIILNQQEFFGRHAETYAFAGLMFWLIAFYLSRISLRVERSLGIEKHSGDAQ